MNTIPDLQLSQELQELYLENKEWRSEIDFLKDEHRFFTKLLNAEKLATIRHGKEQIEMIGTNLALLQQKIDDLENLTSKHQHLLESILSDNEKHIGLELIEQNAAISKEIKFLLASDRQIKKDLFSLVEGVKI
ncbi:hypothetical protein [Pedobacter boryungensis]|uniref:Uncharacterized protein n=1 Tax=Pedobacter boryungensis TaxID=869962 RepID=A0ABX2DC03_9SPHI|nr:hypothetical protein [Pedobacter boryungensis]NQX31589.1 hypothetical protein [Pedobacter boryungensis]